MKKNNYGISILFFSLFLGTLFSCKKTSISANNSGELAKQIVENWRDKTIPVVSDKTKEIINSIVDKLDYSSVTRIDKRKNGIPDYLIKIVDQTMPGSNKYLSLINTVNGYTSEGIYTAQNPEQISRVLREHRLEKGDNILLTNITGSPLIGWQSNVSGKDVLKIATPQKAGSYKSSAELKKSILSNSQKVNYVAPPPGDGCTAWYWVEYDINTGVIVDITYLTTTCPGDPGGGGGTSGALTETQVLDNLENELVQTNFKETISTSAVDAIIRNRTYTWQICEAPSWRGYSNEKGSQEYSSSENRWNWSTFEHVGVSKTGWITGGSVDVSDISSTANIWSQYAGMQVNYHVEWHLLIRSMPATRSRNYTASVIYGVDEQ